MKKTKTRIVGIRPLSPVGIVIAAGTVAFIGGVLWLLIITA